METKNCPRCGRLFTTLTGTICDSCSREEEEIFQRVKTYIEENPDNKIGQISKETEVSSKKILKYIKEGRLVISEGLKGALKCGKCGKPITSGKYCDSCVIEINNQVTELFSKKPAAKMHTK